MIIVKNRELLIPNNERYIGTTYDNDTENRVFQVPRFSQRGVDLAALTFRLDIQYANEAFDTVLLDKEVGEAFIILIWRITSSTLQVPGTMYIGLRAIDDEATVKWSSFSAAMYAERHLNTPGNYGGSLTEIEQIEQDHVYMKGVVDELKSNLDYAHDAEAWAKGTRGGSAVPSTDPTYHKNSKYYSDQAGASSTAAANSATAAASSAQSASDIVASTNARFNNAINAVTTDTEVIDSRVDRDGYTYSTAGESVRGQNKRLWDGLSLVAKKAESPQIVDISSRTPVAAGLSWAYTNIVVPISNGVYSHNPIVPNSGIKCDGIHFLDANGADINISDGSNVITKIASILVYSTLKIDGTTVTVLNYTTYERILSGSLYNSKTYTLADAPVSLKIDTLYLGKRAEVSAEQCKYAGLTIGMFKRYIPYGEYEVFSDELDKHINEIAETYHGDGSIGIREISETDQSYNILNPDYIDWKDTGFQKTKTGMYIPVEGGRYITCTRYVAGYNIPTEFYDENKSLVSTSGLYGQYQPIPVPQNAAYMRIAFGNGASRDNVALYYAREDHPVSDRRPYVPYRFASRDIIHSEIISDDGTELLKRQENAIRYIGVREFNRQRNSIRVGTFNQYIARGKIGWPTIKDVLAERGIDICAFQEVSNTIETGYSESMKMSEFMRGYQFPYGDSAEPASCANRALVSHFPVESTNVIESSIADRQVMKCVITLPKYMRIDHVFKLTVYNYHASLVAGQRLTEIDEILDLISEDTSDFIVICCDSNAFSDEIDGDGKRASWEKWRANGFTPVHEGKYSTVTETSGGGELSLDQIFYGRNISGLNYFIVDSNDYPVTNIYGQTFPLSDHCMLYADLQFDFDAVIREKGYT